MTDIKSFHLASKLVCKYFKLDNVLQFMPSPADSSSMILLDVLGQLKAIVAGNIGVIEQYQATSITNGVFDCLSSSRFGQFHKVLDHLKSINVIKIHLLFSTDGGCFLNSSQSSVWPVQAMILDLPPYERQKPCNILLLGLFFGNKGKPSWNTFVQKIFDSFPEEAFSITVNSRNVTIKTSIDLSIFDLPALASICNITQFNGEFGCPKCCNKGRTEQSGRGKCRIYLPLDSRKKTVENYIEYSNLAEETGQRVFGIKGKSVLSKFLSLPDDIVLDSMHIIYEGVVKSLLEAMVSSKHHAERQFIGRKETLNKLDHLIQRIRVPHDFPKFRKLSYVSSWKAHDLRNFFLFVCFPLLNSLLPPEVSECIFSLNLFAFLLIPHKLIKVLYLMPKLF